MRDAEFRAMLQASRQRNRYNSYSHTDTPPATKYPSSPEQSAKNSIKNYLNNFDSYEQLPSKLDDIFIGFCRSEGHPKYNRKLFYLLKNLDEINASSVTNHLQRQSTRLSYELPSDKYCALLAVMCAKLISIVEHHIAVGNIEPMENEQPDFEFDPYILEEF